MGIIEDLEELYGTKDLYEAIGLSKKASSDQIKAAYRKTSLKVHPDRVGDSEKEEATKKFQILGKIYKILSDEEERKIYDETGRIPDDDSDGIFDWKQFWGSRFGNINEVIKSYTDEYWGSEKEKEDLKACYLKHEGDMKEIIDEMYCRPLEHEPKYRKLIQKWIREESVPEYDKFTKETTTSRNKRKRKYQKEASIANKNARLFEAHIGDSVSDIARLIAHRNEDRLKRQDDFLDRLAAKHVRPKKQKRGESSKSK